MKAWFGTPTASYLATLNDSYDGSPPKPPTDGREGALDRFTEGCCLVYTCPEPSSFAMAFIAIVGTGVAARRRRAATRATSPTGQDPSRGAEAPPRASAPPIPGPRRLSGPSAPADTVAPTASGDASLKRCTACRSVRRLPPTPRPCRTNRRSNGVGGRSACGRLGSDRRLRRPGPVGPARWVPCGNTEVSGGAE